MFCIFLTEEEMSTVVEGERTLQKSTVKASGINTREGVSVEKLRGLD